MLLPATRLPPRKELQGKERGLGRAVVPMTPLQFELETGTTPTLLRVERVPMCSREQRVSKGGSPPLGWMSRALQTSEAQLCPWDVRPFLCKLDRCER